MSDHTFKVGMNCIYENGEAVIDKLDEVNRVALIRDQHTGNLHTRHTYELYPDDAQFHSDSDTYY
ncbi:MULTISPECIES: hypothetical protein [unclassified Agarivorans]|uniref:hypothetical protein n=1 Tax=unclassified Agarivorans TaxID=2636026 RepID=UPI0010DB4288|nr:MULTISPECIES: hypothetical protein [unclassified Agarivorans]MDO6685770.1 hypothetical protein [Agarivorans sp. 3_MG-2023]MDO6716115.1 hypothetical protein [Agarivorans sp. 2_MG-2023]MDO6764281.1 hypothetical protein [Agarivorans sp. 1_MG-2023]GDY26325.1 hypothetical protein AHAT_22150 [Agarivorans sp. Toyoura001]